jgi:hypothetical protein
MIDKLTKLIKKSLEYESPLGERGCHTLYQRACALAGGEVQGTDEDTFHKVFINVIEEYLIKGIIKVEEQKILFCNTSLKKNPNQEYKQIVIGCPNKYVLPNWWEHLKD